MGLPIAPWVCSHNSILAWARHIEEGSFRQTEIIAVVLSALGVGIVGSFAMLLSPDGR